MKILLINPPTGLYDRADRCQAPIKDEGIEMIRPPMDLAYMAAMVEKAGGKAIIRDYPAERKSFLDLKVDLVEIKPDILILSATTPTLDLDLKACELAKKITPKILTVAKGAHFYVFDQEVLKKFSDLDIVIRGEAELVVYDLVQEKKLSRIEGITFRQGKKIIRNSERTFVKNLDDLPFPARHLLKSDLYCFPDTTLPYALILSGRGCPGGCIFCLVGKVSGKKVRIRSVESMLNEISECVEKYNIKTFFFRADTFTWDKNWVKEFCQEIVKKNLKIRWGTNSRVDTLDMEMAIMMKKAGCDIIGLGVESGSQEILKKMKKGINLIQARKAVEVCQKAGLKTLLFFVLGMPWDNKETIEQTITFAKGLSGTFYNFSLAYPFPGTDLAKIAEENNLLDKNSLFGFNYGQPVMKTFYLSQKQLEMYRQKALKSIYLNPQYVLRVLRQIRSLGQLKNYLRHGLVKIYKLISNASSTN